MYLPIYLLKRICILFRYVSLHLKRICNNCFKSKPLSNLNGMRVYYTNILICIIIMHISESNRWWFLAISPLPAEFSTNFQMSLMYPSPRWDVPLSLKTNSRWRPLHARLVMCHRQPQTTSYNNNPPTRHIDRFRRFGASCNRYDTSETHDRGRWGRTFVDRVLSQL